MATSVSDWYSNAHSMRVGMKPGSRRPKAAKSWQKVQDLQNLGVKVQLSGGKKL